MAGRRWNRAFILLVILVAVWLVFCLRQPPEPTYQGKAIDTWIDDWAAHKGRGYYDAVHEIGTNALPYVVRNLARNDSLWHKKYAMLQPKLADFFKKLIPPPKPLLQEVDGANAFFYAGSNSIPCAIKLIKHESPTVRRAAAWGLGALRRQSTAANQAIPALIEALADPDQTVRFDTLLSLKEMGADASNAVPALTKILTNFGPPTNSLFYLQAAAACALGKIGPSARSALPELKSALQTASSPFLRGQAAVAIWRIDGDVETALPVLLYEMPRIAEDYKWDWIIALGEMGPRAKEAVPQLRNELKQDDHRWVLEYVTNALIRIDPAALSQQSTKTN